MKDFLVHYSYEPSEADIALDLLTLTHASKGFRFFTSDASAEMSQGVKCDRLYAYKDLKHPSFAQIFEGPEDFRNLIGDFSYALLHKGKLLLAKDHLGIRPLFYYQDDTKFIAATSVALIKPFAQLVINQDYLARELLNAPQPVEETFYAPIHRFPPAHYGYFDPQTRKMTLSRYWELEKIPLDPYPSEEALYGELQRRLEEAILCRAVGAKKIGCQLSGGLDSSAIAAVLAKHLDRKRIHTFSFVLSEKTRPYSLKGIDEQNTQKAVRKYSALLEENHHTISEFHYKNLQEELERTDAVMGSYANSNAIWQDTLFKHAAEKGVEVSYSGFPGDECVSDAANRYFYDYFAEGKFLPFFFQDPLNHVKPILSYARNRWLGTTRPSYRRLNTARNYLDPSYKKPNLLPSFAFYKSYREEMKAQITRTHTCLRTESEGTYARTHGIETVYPMADIRLISLVYSLPTAMFKPAPYTRKIFRTLCKGLLPEEVRTQQKSNGAMTLAFAEYWHQKKREGFRDLPLADPLGMIQMDKLLQEGTDLDLISRQVKIMELAYSIQQNLRFTKHT